MKKYNILIYKTSKGKENSAPEFLLENLETSF